MFCDHKNKAKLRGVIPRMSITLFWALEAYLWKKRVWSTSGTLTYIYQMKDIHFFKKSLGADFRFLAVRNFYGCCKILYFFFSLQKYAKFKEVGTPKKCVCFPWNFFWKYSQCICFCKKCLVITPLIEISVQKNKKNVFFDFESM